MYFLQGSGPGSLFRLAGVTLEAGHFEYMPRKFSCGCVVAVPGRNLVQRCSEMPLTMSIGLHKVI